MSMNVFLPDVELKEEFLSEMVGDFSDAITHVAKSLLLTKITKAEIELGKDFYNFTPSEIETALRNFRAKSVGSLNTYWSILAKYLIYAEPRRDNVDTTVVKMLSSKQLESFVNKVAEKDRYTTRDELQEMLLNLANPQDQAILIMLFEGVNGKAYSEIANLLESDVDLEKYIIKTPRKHITITDKRTKFILKEALNQSFYFNDKTYEEIELFQDSPYFIKKIKYKNANDGLTPLSASRLKLKIQSFTNEMGGYHLTGKTIYNSGLAERFLKKYGYDVNPSKVSTEEINKFLDSECENISPANLRTIVKNIQEKLNI